MQKEIMYRLRGIFMTMVELMLKANFIVVPT